MFFERTLRTAALVTATAVITLTSGAAFAQKKYDTGASDTEIKIGNIMPYSGPASAYGIIGKTEEAYFKMINDKGGINGRKINFVTYDDGYSPPKAVEQVRKLVESDEVIVVFNPLGTPSNSAIQKYLNAKKIPQLFVATGATKWNDPKNFPWTMGWQPSYQSEAQIYAKWLLKEKPDAKIAILYQNDDFGKDYLKGTKDGLGAKGASMIIMEESYEVSEPSIDGHIVKIKAANPDVLLIYATPKFAAQTIKKTAELSWKPLQILTNVSISVGSVMKPAGFEASQGVLSAAYAKRLHGPAVGQRPRHEEVERVRRQVHAGCRQVRHQHGLRLRRGVDAGQGPGDVRRRSDPGQHHEAGGLVEGFRTGYPAARRQDQHQPNRLRPDRPAPDAAFQGREVGTLRRDHQRRHRHGVTL
ncbi:branched-chain amino acid transport system substrate-binding protein [Bradyrhizobium sp. GM6.1]